jgi:hypothetical protein
VYEPDSVAIKETLQQRTSVLEEHQAAVKTTIAKRRHIERLKGSSNIRPDRVDEALEEMEEVMYSVAIYISDFNRYFKGE